MCRTLNTALMLGAAALTAAVLLLPAAAQDLLPDGPGREATIKSCGGCHGVDFFIGVPRSRIAWENTMIKMMNRGLTMSDEDYEAVAVYLATYAGLSPRPSPQP